MEDSPFYVMKKLTQQDVENRIADKPIRLVSEYVNTQTKAKWECTICQYEWETVPASVLYEKTLCPNCAGRCQSVKTMIKLANSRGFEFLSNRYSGMNCKYKWKCRDGHVWITTAHHIKEGTGCPYCKSYITEEACRFVFQELTDYTFKKNRSILGARLELDGYCKELNMAFEYQGKQHYVFIKHLHRHQEVYEAQKNRDAIKRNLCQEKKISLLEIPYYENDLEQFIREELESLGIECSSTINWNKFKGRISMLEELRIAASELDIESLSNVYINARSKMNFKCKKCEWEWESTSSDIKHGYGCLRCGGRMKLTMQDMYRLAEKNNILFLSKGYINARTKHHWKCIKCENVFWKKPDDIRRGKCCPKCGKKKRWETRRRHINQQKQTFLIP